MFNLKSKKIFLCFFLILPIYAHAYLDPGSGSMLMYALFGILSMILYYAKHFFQKIWFFIQGKAINIDDELVADIIIHSEGKHYETLFMPLLKELSAIDIKSTILLVTQYSRDGLTDLPDRILHQEISYKAVGFLLLNKAKADLFLSTTPQLDVMMWKRSPNVKHYGYIFHSQSDIGSYRYFALDNFDSIFCPSEHVFNSIRYLEKLRKTKAKNLLSSGVLYYDHLVKNYKFKNIKSKSINNLKTLLIAPSWGSQGLFSIYGFDFLTDLKNKFNVIVRPHPQMIKSETDLFNQIKQKINQLGFELDDNLDNGISMAKSDIMLSDFSGIIYDYAFIYQKPIIIGNSKMDFSALEGSMLPNPKWEEQTLSKMGVILTKKNIKNIVNLINSALQNYKMDDIKNFRDETVKDFGNCAPRYVEQIKQLLIDIKKQN